MMSQTPIALASPNTLWAQRNDKLFLTLEVVEAKNVEIKLDDNKLIFDAMSDSNKMDYHLELEFFGQINLEESKYKVNDRNITFLIVKKESGPYWPRLTTGSGKLHFLKTDFSKWKDEDEEEEKNSLPDTFDFSQFAQAGGDQFGQSDVPEVDSDDEDMPELEQEK